MAYPYDSSPAIHVAEVTPHDSTNFPECRALYIGGDGDAVIVCADDSSAPFVGLVAGTMIPVRAVRVNSTNTTATNIVALY